MKKRIALFALIGALAFTGILGVSDAFAQEEQSNPLIQKLVERFSLNEEEVQEFFEEVRSEKREEMQNRFEEILSQAVSDGEITEDQKNLILAKYEEMQEEKESNKEEWQNFSQEERKEMIKEQKETMDAWLEENGIDAKFMKMGGRGHGQKRGF